MAVLHDLMEYLGKHPRFRLDSDYRKGPTTVTGLMELYIHIHIYMYVLLFGLGN